MIDIRITGLRQIAEDWFQMKHASSEVIPIWSTSEVIEFLHYLDESQKSDVAKKGDKDWLAHGWDDLRKTKCGL